MAQAPVLRFRTAAQKTRDKHKTYANHGFLILCSSFFALRGKKEPTKEEKYHAAAG
jgi:hypothetical protein